MKKVGLALSGGGFRASLYHLGLVRFLRDAGILPQVTHITSVSGGSIFAAHLALNWDRYNGSPNDFDAAAAELLAFVNLDIRNRIVRRFPLTFALRWPRWLLGRSNRKLSRTGLLEAHYEKHLYGDTSLFQLPERPQLHILATNLSEGCLCSFNRDGLLMMRRRGHAFHVDHVHVGLATVAMAVTASSAFPGFFPPVELTGADVGASVGEFGRQAYTDGGVFDNLGVRMFRCLERPMLLESPLGQGDFLDLAELAAALRQAAQVPDETPLRRLANILSQPVGPTDPLLLERPAIQEIGSGSLVPASLSIAHGNGNSADALVAGLAKAMRHYQLQHEPLFAALKPQDLDAAALLERCSRSGDQILSDGDQHWLNRHLIEAAVRAATGRACFRRLNSGLDGVLVSDVGKPIEVQSNRRAGGVIRTALRASDILMDRVWQLENETFEDTPGFVFARITQFVEPHEDPTALHPEIQRQAANIRTDVDRFSPLEISSLVRHGYCVARKACHGRADLFGADLPANPPWDPFSMSRGATSTKPAITRPRQANRVPGQTTVEARTLQVSSVRRIFSTLLDYRDWTSYVYVPLLVPLLFLLPYFVVNYYQRSHRINQLIESFAQGSHDLTVISRLLENGPEEHWTGETAEVVSKFDELDLKGFENLQISTIIDLRTWKPDASGRSDPGSVIHRYHRSKVVRKSDNDGNYHFRVRPFTRSPKAEFRFPPQQFVPTLRKSSDVESSVPGEKECRWELSWDFQKVPAGESVDLVFEIQSPGRFVDSSKAGTKIPFEVRVETAEMTAWILLPHGKQYRDFRILRHKTGKTNGVEVVNVVSRYLAEDSTILAFKMLSVQPGYTYEIQWFYK